MAIHMKKGDLAAVAEVLGWDPRGTAEEYEAYDKAQAAFIRIKKEIRELQRRLKTEEELSNHYIRRFLEIEKKESTK